MKIYHDPRFEEYEVKKDINTGEPVVYARDAEENKHYLIVGENSNKITIIGKHGQIENDVLDVSSVDVISEAEPTKVISISGGTEMILFKEELYRSKEPGEKEIPSGKKRGRKKSPKSILIDEELDKYSVDQIPNWNEITDKLIYQGMDFEENRKKIIGDLKFRQYLRKRQNTPTQ